MDSFTKHALLHSEWQRISASFGSTSPQAMAKSGEASSLWSEIVAIKPDPNRPKSGDHYQNGARL